MSFFQEITVTDATLLQGIGVLGFILYVGGFFLVQNRMICGNGIAYPLSKVIAACFVLISLYVDFNLASFLIQVSYIGIGLFGLAMRWRWARSNVPGMDSRMARKTHQRSHRISQVQPSHRRQSAPFVSLKSYNPIVPE